MQKQLMGSVALSAALAAGDVARAEAVQWRVEDGGNGHWYRREAQPLGWPEARARATERGGHLVSIRSQSEYAFIQQAVQLQNDLFWTGGYQDPNACEPACGWRWVTGEPWDYANWNSNEPSDSYGSEHWMECYPGGLWNDRGPGPLVSVVEWSADCNNDGIVDYGQCRDGSLPDYNGNSIPDCCESGMSCIVGRYPVQWKSQDGGNGHWYLGVRFDAAGASWTQARQDAVARGGDLVSLNTLFERQWVFDSVSSNPALWTTTLGPWVGALQPAASQEPAGGWVWVDETPVYRGFYWGDYHPDGNDNCGGPANRMAYWGNYTQGVGDLFVDCADIVRAQCWNIDFGNHPSSVIEWSADCNNDGVVDYGQILQGQLPDANQNGIPDSCEIPNCTSADLFRDFNVNGADLGIMLSQWGETTSFTVSDLNRDGSVDGIDLGLLLAFWGPCPG